jgi:hypothetical protein
MPKFTLQPETEGMGWFISEERNMYQEAGRMAVMVGMAVISF